MGLSNEQGFPHEGVAIAQYPEIAPPTVVVSARYPGANAQVVSDSIATPLEQQINGAENMLYLSSQATTTAAFSSPSRSR